MQKKSVYIFHIPAAFVFGLFDLFYTSPGINPKSDCLKYELIFPQAA